MSENCNLQANVQLTLKMMTAKKQTIKKLKPTKLWCGHIPEIYGYGIMVLELTEDEARKSLKRMFRAWKKNMHGEYGYEKAFEYFGGSVFQIETGKQYYDDLGS